MYVNADSIRPGTVTVFFPDKANPSQVKLSKPPMTDSEFHSFLGSVGEMLRPDDFRLSVYLGGIEPSLRKVAWRHLLNVFPTGLNGKERFEYMNRKKFEYYRLRDDWRALHSRNQGTDDINVITNMVRKDVLRTDRKFSFYAGNDDNKNVVSLFNLLTTYAVTHRDITYCQGMSDLASPILYVQNDEAHAYICFCGLMKRLQPNFALDGNAMTRNFAHLSLLLQHHDPDFYGYLKSSGGNDLFFCYRWLLLELKREFPFEQALLMLEVMWSSLPPDPPQTEVALADDVYLERGLGGLPLPARSNIKAYLNLKSRRQQSCENQQTDAVRSRSREASTSQATRADDQTVQGSSEESNASPQSNNPHNSSSTTTMLLDLSEFVHDHFTSDERTSKSSSSPRISNTSLVLRSNSAEEASAQTPLLTSEPLVDAHVSSSTEASHDSPAISFVQVEQQLESLPGPHEFGNGNPFLMFLCLALFSQHRDHIIKNRLDYNDMAMLFDKMVRKHDVVRTLYHAQSMYGTYLKLQQRSQSDESSDRKSDDVSV